MPLSSTLTNWRTLTRVVNEIKPDASFIKNLVFPGKGQAFSTPEIRFDVIEGDREVAPFVKRGGEAVRITGYGHKRNVLETPNIKLKMEIDPEAYAQTAAAGTVQELLSSNGSMEASVRAQVARDLTKLKRMGTNTLEWMCCRALDGTLSYAGAEGTDSWEIIYANRTNASHDFTFDLSTNAGSTGLANEADWLTDCFRVAKHKVNEATGLNVNIVVGGVTAMGHLMASDQWQKTYAQALGSRMAGNEVNVALTNDIGPNGAIFEGTFGQLPCYTYTRKVTPWGGAAEYLVGENYLYFIAATPAAENEIYYGGIYDVETMNRTFALREFSKSWTQNDPSLALMLYQSRPLPVLRRPYAICRVTVTV